MSPSPAANSDLSPLPRNEEGPVFNEPWEAHAFALAVHLSEVGRFSWPEWSALLGRKIHESQERDSYSGYYHQWLNALEQLCIEKGLVHSTDLHRRKEEWRQSYLHTPHGQPVELSVAVKKVTPAE